MKNRGKFAFKLSSNRMGIFWSAKLAAMTPAANDLYPSFNEC